MGRMAAAGLAVAAAAVGAVVALLVGGVLGVGDQTTTIVEPTVTAPASLPTPAPRSRAAFDPEALYAARAPGVVTIYANLGLAGMAQGSGFVVGRDGVILTNAHVITNAAETRGAVEGARAVYVEFADGERVAARVVGWDLFSDVGVVRVSAADHVLDPVPLGASSAVVVGEPVAAIGSPFGKQSSLTVGVVSATGRSIDSLASGGFAVANAIQIDAPINRGNSGGPLFDAAGRVIGINAQIESTSGTNEGVGFAIPIDLARRSLDQLLRTGRVRYPYIGVSTQDVTPGLAKAFGLGAPRGALVTRVGSGSPADDAGLRGGGRTEVFNGLDVTLGGDVIVAIGGSRVTSADDVSRLVTTKLRPGQTVTFTVLRGSRRIAVDVTLGDRPRVRVMTRPEPLIVVSNRGPLGFRRDADGELEAARGAGGLVTALRPLVDRHDVTWVASAMGDVDREVAAAGRRTERSRSGSPFTLRLVAHDPDVYRLFYSVVANPVLWFVQHGLWDLMREPDADLEQPWHGGYVEANRALAAAAIEELDRVPDAAVFVHDYHLYLVPAFVRAERPEARIAHFTHIPWVGPEAWSVLPPTVARGVHEGLLACDSVGFHTERWRAAFVESSEALLGRGEDATLISHANPIAVDVEEFDALASTDGVRARRAELAIDRPEILVLRVDRVDPSKNAVRGLRVVRAAARTVACAARADRPPGAARPVARGDSRVRGLPARSRARGRRRQRAVRPARLGARLARRARRLPLVHRRVRRLRRPSRQPREGRAQSRREGGSARQRARRRARPLPRGGRVRGAGAVGRPCGSPGCRRAGRGARTRGGIAAGGATRMARRDPPSRAHT